MARAASSRGDGADSGTKSRIIDATIETLRSQGIVGTSARSIARSGGFNQALIFYHFGAVDQALLAALDKLTAERMARYESRLAEVRTLPELVSVASELHAADAAEGHIAVFAQLLAAAHASPEFSRELRARFDPWIDLVEGAVRRVAEGTPFAALVPTGDVAFVVTALFLGLELLTHLETDDERAERVFDQISVLSALLASVAQLGPTTTQEPPSATS